MHFELGTGKAENSNLSGFHFKTRNKFCFHFQVSLQHTASITQLMTASESTAWDTPGAEICAWTWKSGEKYSKGGH